MVFIFVFSVLRNPSGHVLNRVGTYSTLSLRACSLRITPSGFAAMVQSRNQFIFLRRTMVEPKSDTSDLQRFDEMWLHLTPRGATVPYNVCHDSEGNVWVATKGGLFKFDGNRRTTIWERKNMFPKKMAPFPQVVFHNGTIVYTCAEDKDRTTELRFFTLSGEMTHEQFIDGLLISLTIADNGDMYISKQPDGSNSVIYRASMETPLAWEEVVESSGDAFYTLCALDNKTLVAAMSTRPVNMYSNRRAVDAGCKDFLERLYVYFDSVPSVKNSVLLASSVGEGFIPARLTTTQHCIHQITILTFD
ncbi:hypothetical protein Y032_0496g2476 [Ancylostoma ceylanicum]|nr:hypothetical protein Y032_0496g2476 [Ancylostoma ceylanicum]